MEIFIIVCVFVSQIWKLILAYFSRFLIPACEASTSVPPWGADDGFCQMINDSETHDRIQE